MNTLEFANMLDNKYACHDELYLFHLNYSQKDIINILGGFSNIIELCVHQSNAENKYHLNANQINSINLINFVPSKIKHMHKPPTLEKVMTFQQLTDYHDSNKRILFVHYNDNLYHKLFPAYIADKILKVVLHPGYTLICIISFCTYFIYISLWTFTNLEWLNKSMIIVPLI
eukprot:13856_1